MNRWGRKPATESGSKARIADEEVWSERELRIVKEMRSDDTSARLIAQKLNRSIKSVEAQIAELRAGRR